MKKPEKKGIRVDAKGTRIGTLKKGDTLVFTYVEGLWNVHQAWPFAKPDSPTAELPKDLEEYRTAIYLKADSGDFMKLTTLPAGTPKEPFSYTCPSDGTYFLAISKGYNHPDVKGTVKYAIVLPK